MTIILMLINFLFNSPAFAESRTYYLNKKAYPVYLENGVWISKNCQKDCLALKAPTKLEKVSSGASQPARDFCQRSGGKYLMVKDEVGLAEGLCHFSDDSFIFASDYFKKFKTK